MEGNSTESQSSIPAVRVQEIIIGRPVAQGFSTYCYDLGSIYLFMKLYYSHD
ncbi:hypothetical protein ES319_D06G174300v1 [Gossypium barbadense]|uniref:Uncharacterized protein n=1 Tax=Gossypium barbadense TaxID=3634 RepID=A0A5J5R6Z5_GOSBA|nr:hypothetical protein ES319_D06G174300v1 [Gossypium barbadense]